MAVPDYPRLPSSYCFSPQATAWTPSVQLDLPSPGTTFDAEAALRASCALVLATHAGEEVWAVGVDDGVVSGTIECTLGQLIGAVEQLEQERTASQPRLKLVWSNGRSASRSNAGPSPEEATEPLVLFASARGDSFELALRYDTRLLPELEATWFLSHVKETVEAIVRSGDELDGSLAELRLCRPSQAERELLERYSTSGPPSSSYPESCDTLHSFFINSASSHPDQPALVFESPPLTLSYAQLLSLSSHLARDLLARGTISPGQVIPLCIEKRPEMIISMLSILLAGCAYVNMEPSWPEGRKETIVREAAEQGFLKPRIALVGGEQARARWEEWAGEWLSHVVDPVEIVRPWLEKLDALEEVDRTEWPVAKAEAPAYLVYTSGSTGAPKGIIVEHRNVAAFLRNYKGVFGRGVGERVLQFPSYAFDVSVVSIWDTFAQAATLCMASQSALMSDLAGCVIRLGVSLVDLTPTVSALLLEHPDGQPQGKESIQDAWKRAGLSNLKQINTGGEKVERRIRDGWMDRGVRVVIDYGPTETTVGVIANEDRTPGLVNVPIGRPTGLNRVHILSLSSLDEVPLGCIGEICITGSQVTRGYVKKSLNERVFVSHPTYGPLYRTGDLGRWLADGQYSVECLGRRDGQVKVNGLRIEIGEIEQHLSGQQRLGLVRAVVDKLETERISATLVACVELSGSFLASLGEEVPAPGVEPVVLPCSTHPKFLELVEKLKKSVGDHVPGYMVPRYWLAVDRIPTQGMGKTDRKALRALAESHDFRASRKAEGSRPNGAANGRSEEQTQSESEWHDAARRAWGKVLGMEAGEIADADAFTRLGGDSIGFARMASLLRRESFNVSFAKLVEAVTLDDCAEALEQAGKSTTNHTSQKAQDKPPERFVLLPNNSVSHLLAQLRDSFNLEEKDVQDLYPTAPPQDSILAASADSDAYYAQAVYKLDSRIPLDVLTAALAELVKRHDALRTCFAVLEGVESTLQVVLAPESEQVREALEVWRQLECEDVEREVDAWLEEDRKAHSPFAWGKLALAFAVFGSKGGEGGLQLGWSMHHAMSDGFTLELLMTDLRAICHDLALEPRPTFSSFVEWWRALPPPADSTAQFWRDTLAQTTPLEWPSRDALGADEPLSTTALRTLEWKGDLRALAKKQGVTPAIASRVAIAVALAHRARKDAVTLGIVRSGRDVDLAGADEIIGPCVSVLPSLLKLGSKRSLLELMQEEGTADRSARKHQEVTLPQISRWLDLPSREFLFEILVTFQSLAQHEDDEDASAPAWPLRQPPARIKMPTGYSLSFEITPSRECPDELELAVFFDPRVVSTEEVDELLGWVGQVLDWATVRPCATLTELELGQPGETQIRDKARAANGHMNRVSADELHRVAEKVARAWATTLNLAEDEFGHDEAFASLGGDSIRTMRLSVALSRAGLAIPLHSLAKLTTVREQARWLLTRSSE